MYDDEQNEKDDLLFSEEDQSSDDEETPQQEKGEQSIVNREDVISRLISSLINNDDSEFIDDQIIDIPVVPLRETIVFPNTVVPLFIGRKKSINAVNHAMKNNKRIFLVCQKDPLKEMISPEDLEKTGTVSTILQFIKLPDNTIKSLSDGVVRAEIIECYEDIKQDIMFAKVKVRKDTSINQENLTSDISALMRSIVNQVEILCTLETKISSETIQHIKSIKSPSILTDVISSTLFTDTEKKQTILEMISVKDRLNHILQMIAEEIEITRAEREIKEKIRGQMDKNQREYYLTEQMKVIKKELGEDNAQYVEKYENALKEKAFSKEAREKINEELKRLQSMSSMSSEAGVIKSYLDLLISLPWDEFSEVNNDIKKAENALHQNHYGMDKVKDRVLEHIAVQIMSKKNRGSILCLYGPPGVGKTSFARSIAEAVGRKYIKVSLSGLKDEAEIRGHRRTYVGALPGKIISAMKKAGVSNPLILLDEVDKMSSDYRGDPSSAMLEILDPEQNKNFNDHYMEIDYDLSNVMFIATANTLDMPSPLLDRMELIRLPSYLENEKLEIAKKYIVKKQFDLAGLNEDQFTMTDNTIKSIIKSYTRESGVRELERCISKIAHKVTKKVLEERSSKKKNLDTCYEITEKNLHEYLGIKKYSHNEKEKKDLIGITNGLAYTEVGGDILLIEAVKIPGKGEIKCTGKLGDVMKESVQAAYNYIKSRGQDLGIDVEYMNKYDVHLHVPEGATPKDGPSAGIAICTTIVSLFTNTPVKKDVAMTGEMTLRGRVLAIGGLREKLVSAVRSQIKTVLIPKENLKDLEDIPKDVLKKLNIKTCSSVDEVLRFALMK